MKVVVDPKEAIQLGITDALFFYQAFFPRTVRDRFASFHRTVSDDLEDPRIQYLNLQMFRGSAKTSFIRMFTARRIAYRVSRTILYIGASEGHAARSVQWIKTQIERNKLFRDCFQLQPGSKWTESELQIWHGVEQEPIWLIGVGITGSIRGINFDDFRPDLILLDDVLTDENVATPEGRQKMNSLILGAVAESLAPRTEAPNSKLVMNQTPIHREDPSCAARLNPLWTSRIIPCWTPETLEAPIQEQESAWPERFPSETLRARKLAAVSTNELSTFLRELECKLVAPETSAFRAEWLRYWDEPGVEHPQHGFVIVSVDPIPPPSDVEVAKNLHGKHYEAVTVLMRAQGNYYLLAYALNRGHNPTWTATTVEAFVREFSAVRVVFDATAYQRVLGNTIIHHLQRKGLFTAVHPITDNRKKFTKIVGTLHGLAVAGKFWISRSHIQFQADWATYPTVNADDLLDSAAMGISHLANPVFEHADGFFGPRKDEFTRPLRLKRANFLPPRGAL